MADEKKQDKEETIVMVGDGVDSTEDKSEKADATEGTDDGVEDEEDSDEEESSGSDTRMGHAEGEEEGEDAHKSRRRQEREAKKERVRKARERTEKELNFLRSRNEQLERRFSAVEGRQRNVEASTLTTQISTLESQIEEAKAIEAAALESKEEGSGADAVEARDIRQALETRRDQLVQARDGVKKGSTSTASREVPPEVQRALSWIKENDWYDPDPNSADEDTAIAKAVEASMLRAGFNPRTPEYWTELDKRLRKRIPEVFKNAKGKSQAVEDSDDEDEEPPRRESSRREAPAKKNGGPVVTVGGQQRHLKANEVYVSPERRKHMEDAGMWDDPVLRNRLLKRYQQWDREQGNT